MGRGHRLEPHDDFARLIKEEVLLGSVCVFPFSVASVLLMIANSAHTVLMLLGSMVMGLTRLWSAALIKVTEVILADAEGIRCTRWSPLVPTLCDRRVSYGEVKEAAGSTSTTGG